jgi:hypothetical protein
MFARLLETYPHPEGGKWTGPRMQEATGGFVNAAYFSNLLTGRIKQPGQDKLKVIAVVMDFPRSSDSGTNRRDRHPGQP